MNFFTADLHFDHGNILGCCNRPFGSVIGMNNGLIKNWNDIVAPNDKVYIIGDLSMTRDKNKLETHIKRLNGIKILVRGNHDYLKSFDYIDIGFQSEHTSLEITLSNEEEFILCHDPAPACNTKESRRWLTGHVHNLYKGIDTIEVYKKIINVGVDVWDYKPVSEKQILELIYGQ